jgi:uncharacterized protein YerC
MPRVSKIKLDKDLEIEIFRQFWNSLAEIDSSLKASDFFTDLLSETEKLMLAKRFAVAVLVSRNKQATEIHNAIHVSYTTIASVSSWVKNGKPKTQELLQKISKEKGWENTLDIIEDVLDKIHPARGTDWAEKYKERRVRRNKRFARENLR